MRAPESLQARLALALGVALSLLWLAAAAITVESLRRDMAAVFDSALQETAQRLLPLAVLEIVNRDGTASQHLAPIRAHDELITYVVRDAAGAVLMRSHAAELAAFPVWDGTGFSLTPTHRLYGEETLGGSIRLTLAEPLAHRRAVLRGILLRQTLPLLLALPLTLGIVWAALRLGLAGVRRYRDALAARGAADLAPVPTDDLPAELRPVAETLNTLLATLAAAVEAERSFAANAAHELRTPLAGAIAQAQLIRAQSPDPAAADRAAAIEATLKRLARTAERLMELARAEGARLTLDHATDLRPVLRLLASDAVRAEGTGPVALTLPDTPVLSDLDPDAFAVLARNLIENAQRHGAPGGPVDVILTADGALRVANDGPVVAPADLDRLTDRFARAGSTDGSGLGLAIVAAIARRTGARLDLASPRPGKADGFAASVALPPSGQSRQCPGALAGRAN